MALERDWQSLWVSLKTNWKQWAGERASNSWRAHLTATLDWMERNWKARLVLD